MKKVYKRLFGLCTALGFMVILLSCEASDTEVINTGTLFLHGFAGLGMASVGAIGLGLTELIR